MYIGNTPDSQFWSKNALDKCKLNVARTHPDMATHWSLCAVGHRPHEKSLE